MAESNSRNAMIAVALIALAVVVLLWWASGGDVDPATSTAPQSADRAAPTLAAPDQQRTAVAEARPTPRPTPIEAGSNEPDEGVVEEEWQPDPRVLEDPVFQQVDAESARRRMELFDQAFSPEFVEGLRYPKKPELPPEELDRLQNPPEPSEAELEFLIRHGEEAAAMESPPVVLDPEQPSNLSPAELERLENPVLEVR